MNSFEKKNVIITGGSGSIGLSLSNFLIKKNFKIFNFDKNPSKNKNVINFKCDLNNRKQIKSKFFEFKKKYKIVFSLINCAAYASAQNTLNYDIKKWDKIISINLTAPFILTKLASNLMKSKKIKGSIVNITSISSNRPMSNAAAYNASKAGLENLGKSFAIDLASYGIRVNNLSPGYTRTAMTIKSWKNKKKRKKITNKTLLARWGNPEDFNEAAYFLIDPKKSGYMTGADLVIDGGWSIKSF